MDALWELDAIVKAVEVNDDVDVVCLVGRQLSVVEYCCLLCCLGVVLLVNTSCACIKAETFRASREERTFYVRAY